MEFSMEELRETLEEMGFKGIAPEHLELFAKDLKRLMKHEQHVKKREESAQKLPPGTSASQPVIPPETSKSAFQPAAAVRLPPQENQDKKSVDLPKEKALQQDEQASWKRLKTDPVRLYSWYKTFWDVHGLNNNK